MADRCIQCDQTIAAAREAVRAALQMPDQMHGQILQYARLFKPVDADLTIKQFGKILNDLLPMIHAGKVDFESRQWQAPHAYWSIAFEALYTARETLDLPLDNHDALVAKVVNLAKQSAAKTTESVHVSGNGPKFYYPDSAKRFMQGFKRQDKQ